MSIPVLIRMLLENDKTVVYCRRTQDKTELPISGIKVGDELSFSEFRNQVEPLYRWSVQQGCRFYVIRFSADGNVRADLVNAIDSFFYPDSRIQVRPRR